MAYGLIQLKLKDFEGMYPHANGMAQGSRNTIKTILFCYNDQNHQIP